jgi:hypothetical protein
MWIRAVVWTHKRLMGWLGSVQCFLNSIWCLLNWALGIWSIQVRGRALLSIWMCWVKICLYSCTLVANSWAALHGFEGLGFMPIFWVVSVPNCFFFSQMPVLTYLLPKPIEVYYQTWWIWSHPLSLYEFRTARFSYWLCSCRAFGSWFLQVWWMYFYARKQNQNDDSFLRLQCLYLSYAFEQNSSILKQIVQIGSRTTRTSSGMKVI